MRRRITRVGALLITGAVGISVSIMFDFIFQTIYITLWVFYIWVCYIVFYIFKLLTANPFLDTFMGIYWTPKLTVIVLFLFCISIFGGWKIYNSGFIETLSYKGAHRISTHIVFKQGNIPCISLGAACM